MSYPNYNATAAADTQVNLPPITETTVATDPLSGTTYGMYGVVDQPTYATGLGYMDPASSMPVLPMERPLVRDMTNNWFGGVLAGIANKFDISVNLLRLLFVLSCLVLPGAQCIFFHCLGHHPQRDRLLSPKTTQRYLKEAHHDISRTYAATPASP